MIPEPRSFKCVFPNDPSNLLKQMPPSHYFRKKPFASPFNPWKNLEACQEPTSIRLLLTKRETIWRTFRAAKKNRRLTAIVGVPTQR